MPQSRVKIQICNTVNNLTQNSIWGAKRVAKEISEKYEEDRVRSRNQFMGDLHFKLWQ